MHGTNTKIGALVEGPGVSTFNYGEIREEPACIVAGTRGRSPRLVSLNRWLSQLVVLNVDSMALDTRAVEINRVLVDVPLDVVPSTRTPNSYVARDIEIACGSEYAIVSFRRYDDSATRLATTAHLVLIQAGSGKHGVRTISSAAPAALGSLKAALGTSFFIAHNSRFGFPQVVELRLRVDSILSPTGN